MGDRRGPARRHRRGAAAHGRGRGRGGRGGGTPRIWVRDPFVYYFTVFGEPSAQGGWGFRVEGHHVSLHFAIDNGQTRVTSGPQFIGSNPREVLEGPRAGFRVLAAQEDAARALVVALDDASRAVAVVSPTPRRFSTGTTVKVDPLDPVGLPTADMTAAQREMLMTAIDTYVGIMPADVAADRMAKIEGAGIEKVAFAWSGSLELGQAYQYQIVGPTFAIEHNNTQNNGNHIHAVWRDYDGDFGRDLLAEHMAALPH